MSDTQTVADNSAPVEFDSAVLQQIRRHARTSMTAEICGVLIGQLVDGVTHVGASIAGEDAKEAGAHVTFTQETWQHIYKIKDSKFADESIVGWYHSHPGFGIFLSDYDLFIHKNFFAAPHHVAWVFDPHSDDEGCFGWVSGDIAPIERISVVRQPTKTYLKAAEIGPDVSSIDTAITPFKRRRLNFLDVKKWSSYMLRLRFLPFKKLPPYFLIAVTVLLFGAAIYRYRPALQFRHIKAMSLPQDEKANAKWITTQLSSPKADEIFRRYGRSLNIKHHEIRGVTGENFLVIYKWTSPDTPNGSTTYKYTYDRQARKIHPQFNSSGSPMSTTDKTKLSRIAEELGDLLFKEN
jgi:proteasome lid subunit RPN8/RPN11